MRRWGYVQVFVVRVGCSTLQQLMPVDFAAVSHVCGFAVCVHLCEGLAMDVCAMPGQLFVFAFPNFINIVFEILVRLFRPLSGFRITVCYL